MACTPAAARGDKSGRKLTAPVNIICRPNTLKQNDDANSDRCQPTNQPPPLLPLLLAGVMTTTMTLMRRYCYGNWRPQAIRLTHLILHSARLYRQLTNTQTTSHCLSLGLRVRVSVPCSILSRRCYDYCQRGSADAKQIKSSSTNDPRHLGCLLTSAAG